MPLPMATTTISTTRSANDGTIDLYDTPAAPAAVVDGVRAVIGSPRSRVDFSAGMRVVTTAAFDADPCDIQAGDALTDNTTGRSYEVIGVISRYELGLSFVSGLLQIIEGATA
jgi:hypothetical protein